MCLCTTTAIEIAGMLFFLRTPNKGLQHYSSHVPVSTSGALGQARGNARASCGMPGMVVETGRCAFPGALIAMHCICGQSSLGFGQARCQGYMGLAGDRVKATLKLRP